MTITEKAERMLLAGNVSIHGTNGAELAAIVRGDHDLYAVVREKDRWRCTCPARKKCSHIEAVERVT
jgi:uncharacterized Zn finger protein